MKPYRTSQIPYMYGVGSNPLQFSYSSERAYTQIHTPTQYKTKVMSRLRLLKRIHIYVYSLLVKIKRRDQPNSLVEQCEN